MTAVEQVKDDIEQQSFPQRVISRLFPLVPIPEKRPVARSFWSNPLAGLLFSDSFRVVRTSISRQLDLQDISTLNPQDASEQKSKEIWNNFTYYKERKSKMPLVRALEKSYRTQVLSTGLCAALSDLGTLCQPLLFCPLITYLTLRKENEPGWQYTFGAGVGFLVLTFINIILIGLARTHKINISTFAGASMKTSLDSILLQKSFRISQLARRSTATESEPSDWSAGAIYNIMNTDSERIFNASRNIHSIWTSTLAIPLAIGVSYWLIGWTGIAGLATMVAHIPIVWLGAKILAKARRAANALADRRNDLISDAIRNIRFLKCYVWESHFFQRSADVRKQETEQNYILATVNAFMLCIDCAASRIPGFTGILLLSYFGDVSDASRVIPYFLICMELGYVWFELAPAVNDGVNAYTSINRIEEFLLAEEKQDVRVYDSKQENSITLKNTKLIWERENSDTEKAGATADGKQFNLDTLNLEIKPAELIAVVGPSGCGKSSLVAGICGDMPCVGGEITLNSSVAYCPQRPWIQNATVKENVLFGVPYEKEKYDGIINDCALAPDIKELVNQDETQLGELGINISGGQKQRVQLARTLYMNRDIVVMDDPLAAVDARTSRHLFENVICGRLKDKCRILVTHQLQILNRVDRIVFMENGKIVAFDTYDNLLNIESFNRFLSECRQHQEEEEKEEEDEKDEKDADGNLLQNADKSNQDNTYYELLLEEERAISSVSTQTYLNYVRAGGSFWLLAVMYGVCIISQVFNVLVGISFAWWTDNRWNLSNTANMGIALAMMLGHLVTWTAFMVFVLIFCTRASKNLSLKALNRVMNAPVPFFNKTPLGRIINRFTVDTNQLDSVLPFSLWQFSLESMSLVAVVGMTIAYVHVSAALIIPWVLLSVLIIYMYKASPREIKRLESLSGSKVTARLSEGHSGKDSIRSTGQEGLFIKQLHSEMDDLNGIRREFYCAVQWAAMRQNIIASIYYLLVGILGLSALDSIEPAVFATFLSYASFAPICMGYVTENVTQVQRNMVSVERLQHYATNIESEGIKRVENFKRDEKDWPLEGSIKFDGVDMRYDDNLPLSLKNMNLDIRGGSKVGVVGRTGAGKSSLFQVLLRMVKISKGSICIDGIDITTQMGLHDLRECIAVIPQDPTLFEGTVRSNLDPMGKKDDYELNAALKSASLLNEENNFSLEYKISAGGDNLSNGQRQLMALARALVKDSKIIMSDEATSSVDFETDAKVQSVMMGLESKTVLSIAHRIRTVLHYDYICVMHNGEIVEYDTPLRLFDKPGSIFRSMCEESKLSREDLF